MDLEPCRPHFSWQHHREQVPEDLCAVKTSLFCLGASTWGVGSVGQCAKYTNGKAPRPGSFRTGGQARGRPPGPTFQDRGLCHCWACVQLSVENQLVQKYPCSSIAWIKWRQCIYNIRNSHGIKKPPNTDVSRHLKEQWGIFRGNVIRGSLIFWLVDSNDFCVVNQGSFGTLRVGVQSSSFPFCFYCWLGRVLLPAPAWTLAAMGWPGASERWLYLCTSFLSFQRMNAAEVLWVRSDNNCPYHFCYKYLKWITWPIFVTFWCHFINASSHWLICWSLVTSSEMFWNEMCF